MKRYAKSYTKTVHGPVHNRAARRNTRRKRAHILPEAKVHLREVKKVLQKRQGFWRAFISRGGTTLHEYVVYPMPYDPYVWGEEDTLESERKPFIDDPYVGDDLYGLEGW